MILLAVSDVSKESIDDIYSSIIRVLVKAEARFSLNVFLKFW